MESSGSEFEGDDSDSFVPQKQVKKTASKPLTDTTNSTTPSKNAVSDASDQYKRLSQLEHILKRPDTYIGSVERSPMEMWSFDTESESMVFGTVSIVPGLYKIFDEILVNAADNKIRDPNMKNIKVKIDAENNMILVMNDGKGIPVEIHKKEKIYIPELIFGNLLTSSNYDDDERKVTGGRNGYGAKLCNIFSTDFVLETADKNTGLVYRQQWNDNMSRMSKPKVTKMKTKTEYTRVSFKPDLGKFGMDSLDKDTLAVLTRRVYDLCGTVKNCNIYLNDKKLDIKGFKNYVQLYVKAIKDRSPAQFADSNKPTLVYEVINDRWEVAFAVSDGVFNQVSFVNSIATTSGGSHVKYITDQIVNKLTENLSRGDKKSKIKPNDIKNNMFLFVNCLIENPAFTSQTKEHLTTKVSQFGGKKDDKILVSSGFISKIMNTSIVDIIKAARSAREDIELQKADGSRKLRIKNQVKLVDANKAGTKEGHKCTLILTEGDSALSLAVAGLAVVGRNYYGCFPLRGKLLNVREASADQIAKNAEINALKQIIGLKHKVHYSLENIKDLRYGHIMIMTDQDHDGSHIKGLIINFLDTSFPGLLQIPGFLLEFITPIVKVFLKNKKVLSFYTMPEFEQWRETEGKTQRWRHKYYKGLGTSTLMEGREYFAALDRHLKKFHALQGDDKLSIDLAFSKKKADDRKEWLQCFEPGTHLDPLLQEIPISDFINKELILFSMADNIRSIPSVLDGLKPGQRKVLYACFRRNLTVDIKVSQLAGYVSENTGYHHGEASLVQTIIGLAQDFIGSNNLNVLKPIGTFGSRAAGGKDFSAARYIFTQLSEITKKVFNPLDNPLYTYVQEDEGTVEPEWYLPVLPMVLVNGAEGIGTGWSTNIPPFNPTDIVQNIRRLMAGEEMIPMTPWFKGWEGEIQPISQDKFRVMGTIEQIDNTTLEISEIPPKTWINNMKEFLLSGLDSKKDKPWIKDVEEHHGMNIKFIIKLSEEEMAKSHKIGLLERFKLISVINLSNMVLFDPSGRIKKYESPLQILREFFYVRLEYYQRRKDFLTDKLQNQLLKLSEQARFIKHIIDNKISLSNKKRSVLVKQLQELDFAMFDKDGKKVQEVGEESLFVDPEELMEEEEQQAEDITQVKASTTDNNGEHKPDTVYAYYDYLLGMTMWSLTKERYEKLLSQKDDKEKELNILLRKSAKDLWNEDLEDFMVSWEKFLQEDLENRSTLIPMKGTKKSAKRTRTTKQSKQEPPKKKQANEKKQQTLPVKTEPTDDLPTFFETSSKEISRPAAEKPAKRVLSSKSSKFDDSDDDLLLGLLDKSSDSSSTASMSAKQGPSNTDVAKAPSTSTSKTSTPDIFEMPDTQSSAPTTYQRKKTKPKASYKFLSSGSEEENDSLEFSEPEDDDDYEEED